MSEDRPDEARKALAEDNLLSHRQPCDCATCQLSVGVRDLLTARDALQLRVEQQAQRIEFLSVLEKDNLERAEAAEARVRQLEQERDTVRLELTVLGEETERYVRQAEALLVRLRTLPRHEVGLMDGREHAYAEVVKWTDLEAILSPAASVAAPHENRIFCPTCGRRRVPASAIQEPADLVDHGDTDGD